MAREKITIRLADYGATIAANGQYRIYLDGWGGSQLTVTAIWATDAVPPAGTLTFSVDGDPGQNNVLDLSGGKRTMAANGFPAVVDVDVTGLPAGGTVNLLFRG